MSMEQKPKTGKPGDGRPAIQLTSSQLIVIICALIGIGVILIVVGIFVGQYQRYPDDFSMEGESEVTPETSPDKANSEKGTTPAVNASGEGQQTTPILPGGTDTRPSMDTNQSKESKPRIVEVDYPAPEPEERQKETPVPSPAKPAESTPSSKAASDLPNAAGAQDTAPLSSTPPVEQKEKAPLPVAAPEPVTPPSPSSPNVEKNTIPPVKEADSLPSSPSITPPSPSDGRYGVQVAAFRQRAQADKFAAQHKDLDAYVQDYPDGYSRVLVGRFDNETSARAFAQEMKTRFPGCYARERR